MGLKPLLLEVSLKYILAHHPQRVRSSRLKPQIPSSAGRRRASCSRATARLALAGLLVPATFHPGALGGVGGTCGCSLLRTFRGWRRFPPGFHAAGVHGRCRTQPRPGFAHLETSPCQARVPAHSVQGVVNGRQRTVQVSSLRLGPLLSQPQGHGPSAWHPHPPRAD